MNLDRQFRVSVLAIVVAFVAASGCARDQGAGEEATIQELEEFGMATREITTTANLDCPVVTPRQPVIDTIPRDTGGALRFAESGREHLLVVRDLPWDVEVTMTELPGGPGNPSGVDLTITRLQGGAVGNGVTWGVLMLDFGECTVDDAARVRVAKGSSSKHLAVMTDAGLAIGNTWGASAYALAVE